MAIFNSYVSLPEGITKHNEKLEESRNKKLREWMIHKNT